MTKKKTNIIILCPTCEGEGVVKCEIELPSKVLHKACYDLHQARWSLRQIANKMGFKGPQLAKWYIDEWKKHLKSIEKIC